MKRLTFQAKGTKKAVEIHVKTEDLSLFISQFEEYIKANLDFFHGGKFEIIGIESSLDLEQKLSELESKYPITTKVVTRKKFDPTLLNSTNFTNYHLKTIRSGQSITYDGDVVLLGDVNSGGEIRATGSITISGTLRGIAHCGYPNNNQCFIIASKMNSTQLRIGENISSVGSQSFFQKEARIAYLKENEIKITSISEWQKRGE
ncbi:hypothetical protein HYG86_01890 [Alkalicella caledoniensis]|uniref:Probable septum site-determining protein MinC n=1 Tax=Alkalicella caledoniensis TaxID=2731377 RepID=A0A7G9W4J5_ALKCA|nr:septum site-determining protein MinC [Alkalicella caledoniensis]QNO13607.1 hypothetical protein HYG86_01890 [Alkalicella caledoniensis]